MKMHSSLAYASFVVLCGSLVAGPLQNLPAPKSPKEAAVVNEEASRWSIGAGIVFREIESDFTLNSPLPFRSLGRGDVGLHKAGSNTINYDDGRIGPGYGIFDGHRPDGTSYVVINSKSQLTKTGRIDTFGNPIYNLAFHTFDTTYTPHSFHSSDEDLGVGPYVELRYTVCQGASMDVNLMLGYSWVSADLGSGTGVLMDRSTSYYTYNYEYDVVAAGALTGKYPFHDGAYAITNPGGSYNDGTYRGPKKSKHSDVDHLLGRADLNVDLHEIVLAPELMFAPCKGVRVGIQVGPTLNFINSDFDAVAWWDGGSHKHGSKSYKVHDSGTDVKLGVATQVTLMVDLTRRLFFQASASYRYVPSVDVGTGFGTASIDTTAWQSALGFGLRL